MEFSREDPELSFVKETPCADGNTTTESPLSFSKGETSPSTIIHDSSAVEDQLSSHPMSLTNHNKNSSKAGCFIVVTPQKNAAVNTSSSMSEMESSLNLSVNSCSLKRKKPMYSSPLICLIEEEHDAIDACASDCTTFIKNSTANEDANRRIDFGAGSAERKLQSGVPQQLTMNNSTENSGLVMNDRRLIYCSLCKSALGLPDNRHYVTCYLTSSSKVHLEALHRKIVKPQTESKSKGIHVLVTDISSVHQQLCNRTLEGGSEQGIWSEKDGCVFNTIFCPFCSTGNNCLGVQVMATNASNIHLLNKVWFLYMYT